MAFILILTTLALRNRVSGPRGVVSLHEDNVSGRTVRPQCLDTTIAWNEGSGCLQKQSRFQLVDNYQHYYSHSLIQREHPYKYSL